MKAGPMIRSMTTTGTDGSGRLIPKPRIPPRPLLSWDALRPVAGDKPACVLDAGPNLHLTSGRMAIALALEIEGLGAGDEILLPAYHCTVMVEPACALGLTPVFYRVGLDLAADLDDIAAKRTGRTRALLAASYFGFPQDWQALRSFCDRHRLILIEDCAHSLFGTHDGQPAGSFGDWAVASLTKFLPSWDGGTLTSARHGRRLAALNLVGQGVPAEARALLDPLAEAVGYGRLPLLRPLIASLPLLKAMLPRGSGSAAANPAQRRSGAKGDFDSAWVRVRGSRAASAMVRWLPRQHIAARRRAAWRRLADGFADCQGCRPLRPDMTAGMVPYMFPLWVDDLPAVFPRLEDLAIPMQRFGQFPWPEMDPATCPDSRLLSRHLIQLPCHQDLTAVELDWIIAQVRSACTPAGCEAPAP